MSQPKFSTIDPPLTRDDVINQVVSSIAMEELGLSHIINAEGEKIQYVLGTIEGVTGPTEPATIDELLEINKSVRETLESTMQNQMILKGKLETALTAPTMQGEQGPTGPVGPAGLTSGLGSFAGIYNNTKTSVTGTANVPIVIPMPFTTSSRNVSYTIPNSITILEKGAYYLTYDVRPIFDVNANLVFAVRSNGTNIAVTESQLKACAAVPVWCTGSRIVELPTGAAIDMVVTSDADVIMSFDEVSIESLNIFKLD